VRGERRGRVKMERGPGRGDEVKECKVRCHGTYSVMKRSQTSMKNELAEDAVELELEADSPISVQGSHR